MPAAARRSRTQRLPHDRQRCKRSSAATARDDEWATKRKVNGWRHSLYHAVQGETALRRYTADLAQVIQVVNDGEHHPAAQAQVTEEG